MGPKVTFLTGWPWFLTLTFKINLSPWPMWPLTLNHVTLDLKITWSCSNSARAASFLPLRSSHCFLCLSSCLSCSAFILFFSDSSNCQQKADNKLMRKQNNCKMKMLFLHPPFLPLSSPSLPRSASSCWKKRKQQKVNSGTKTGPMIFPAVIWNLKYGLAGNQHTKKKMTDFVYVEKLSPN